MISPVKSVKKGTCGPPATLGRRTGPERDFLARKLILIKESVDFPDYRTAVLRNDNKHGWLK